MGELKKLTPQELEELRNQLRQEQEKSKQDESSLPLENRKLITVSVSQDRLQAYVTVEKPEPTESATRDDIMAQLRKNNVVYGYDEVALDRLAAGLCYGESVLVAQGKDVEQGQDGYFTFFFETEERKEPIIREDGTVDYSSVGRLENINEGDIIAQYHPAIQGVKGCTVTGTELVPKMVKDLPPLRGKKISRDDETGEYRATVSGKISYAAGNIQILTVHEIHEDVDLIMGAIEFYGDIVIYGNVEAGVVIRAGRNITVEGTVSGARLFAGGDIVLKKGVQGGQKGSISARKSVFADFIEHTKVDAGMDVNANSIINSIVNAGGSVIAKGKRGSIMGGYIHALRSITANNVGSKAEMKTILHTGYTEQEYRAFSALVMQERKLKAANDNLIEKMTQLLQLRKEGKVTFTKKQQDELLAMNTQKDEFYKQLDELEEARRESAEKLKKGEHSWIAIVDVAYPGTVISIDVSKLVIQNKETYVRFIRRNDIIERTAIIAV